MGTGGLCPPGPSERKAPSPGKSAARRAYQAPVLAQRLCAASGVVVTQQPHSQAPGVRLPMWPQGLLTSAGSWETPREAPESSPSPAACRAPLSGSGDGEAGGLV